MEYYNRLFRHEDNDLSRTSFKFEVSLMSLITLSIPLLFVNVYSLVSSIIGLHVIVLGFIGAYSKRRNLIAFYNVVMMVLTLFILIGFVLTLVAITGNDHQFLFFPVGCVWNIIAIVLTFTWILLSTLSIYLATQVKRLLDYYHFSHTPTVYTSMLSNDHNAIINSNNNNNNNTNVNNHQPFKYDMVPNSINGVGVGGGYQYQNYPIFPTYSELYSDGKYANNTTAIASCPPANNNNNISHSSSSSSSSFSSISISDSSSNISGSGNVSGFGVSGTGNNNPYPSSLYGTVPPRFNYTQFQVNYPTLYKPK